MSENIKIHHESMIGTHFEGRTSRTSVSWLKITCDECKLEQPVQAVAGRPEYCTPADVAARSLDPAIGGPSLAEMKAEHARRRLHAARAAEEFARDTMAYWAKQWEEAASLLRKLENDAGVPEATPGPAEPVQTLSGVQKFSDLIPVPARPAEGDYADLPVLDVSLLKAPVNAVDIRTDVREDEGMTDKLSEAAKSALINASGSMQGASVLHAGNVFSHKVEAELKQAGLIGDRQGLTRQGSIAREKLTRAAEDQAFG